MISDKFKKLKRKRILITAGPTWVAIDSVRVISNIASGETGILLAKEAAKRGAAVTLVLGPSGEAMLPKAIRVISFKFFDELKNIVISELKSKTYDAVIHSAAVSDFKPERITGGKISSGRIRSLKLLPLPKIIYAIRKLTPAAKLVMFKLEPGVCDSVLIKRAKSAMGRIRADFVVANQLNPYRAFILDNVGNKIPVKNKRDLAKKILKLITHNS